MFILFSNLQENQGIWLDGYFSLLCWLFISLLHSLISQKDLGKKLYLGLDYGFYRLFSIQFLLSQKMLSIRQKLLNKSFFFALKKETWMNNSGFFL